MRAAKLGHMGAQNDVGHFYQWGRGAPQDLISAYQWYSIAAEFGNGASAFQLPFLEQNMQPEGVSEAKRCARLCMESHFASCDG